MEGVAALMVGEGEGEAFACEAGGGGVEFGAVEGYFDLVLLARWEGSVNGLADGDVEEAYGTGSPGGIEAEDGLVLHCNSAESRVAGEGYVVGFSVDSDCKAVIGIGGECCVG